MAQTKAKEKTQVQVIKDLDQLPLDPLVKTGKLPNGFKYFIRKNTEPKNRVQLYLALKAGSVLESEEQRGLAHFIEHMSFNGTKNFPKNALVDYLQKSGVRFGADLNAYTSFDETVYQLPLPTDDPALLKNGMKIMRDWAQNALLETSEINKERGVILEEKRLGKGAQQRMQMKTLPVLVNHSRYAQRIPIGTDEVLNNFKPETLKKFYHDWYRPDLQALIVVGDIDVAQTEATIKALFSDMRNPVSESKRTQYEIPLTGKNQFIAVTDKEMPYTVAQILVKQPEMAIKTKADMRVAYIRALYNEMMGSRISELMKQSNPPFMQAQSTIGSLIANLDAATNVVVAKPGELESGFKALYTELERARRFGFGQAELDRARQSMLTSMETSYKERDKTPSQSYVQEYLQYFLKGTASPGIAYEYALSQKLLPEIKLSEVNKLVSSSLANTNRDVVLMAPEKDAAGLPNEATVNKWIADVNSLSINAYVDQTSDKPLMATKPSAGKITSEKKLDKLGVTELTFSNGVKAILKPTNFKNDQILFSASSPGGSSLYPDKDYESASIADQLASASGVSEFNSIALPKMLSGKVLSIQPYISSISEGFSGSASPKDLETALQLQYLYFTQPRIDTAIFNSMVHTYRASLANRSQDPGSVFSDTISAVLGGYNVRRTGPSLEKIKQMDAARAFSIYKDRFADAGDFTFTFVGNFDVEKIKPLLEQYLGSLPSTGRKENFKDLGIRPLKGTVNRYVYKGSEDKATVRLMITGDYTYDDNNNSQLDALAEVLQIRLIERLREEESGVYSPNVSAQYAKYPAQRYGIVISFGCAPSNVDRLVSSTMDEIKKLGVQGPSQVNLDKYKAEEHRSLEVAMKQNSFWLGSLSGAYENHEDPEKILHIKEMLDKVTVKSVQEAAKKYTSGENLIKFVLVPEKK